MADIKLLYGTKTNFDDEKNDKLRNELGSLYLTTVDSKRSYLYFGNGTNFLNIVPELLTVSNGGTGRSFLSVGYALIGNGANEVTLRPITDNGTVTYINPNTNLITANTLKYWDGSYDANGSSSIQYLGTISKGTWTASVIAVSYGGTGRNTFTLNGIPYGNNTSALQVTAAGTDGQIFTNIDGIPQFLTPTISWASATSATTGPFIEFKLSKQNYKAAIPVASTSASGVMTYGDQEFAGVKTFTGATKTSNIYPRTNNTYTSGTPSSAWKIVYGTDYDVRDVNTIQVGRFASTTTGTTSATGVTSLYIGNNIASGTAGNSQGYLYIYGTNTGYTRFNSEATTSTYNIAIPATSGNMVISNTSTTDPTSATVYYLPFYITNYKKISMNDGIRLSSLQGTTTVNGFSLLILGNPTAGGTAGNKYGAIRLYSKASTYNDIIAHPDTSTAGIRLPSISKNAEFVYHDVDTSIGSTSQAVYIGIDGKPAGVTQMDVSYGGTGVTSHTANRLVWSTSNRTIQATNNHFVNATKIAINYTSEPSYNFYVNGTSYFTGNTSIAGKLTMTGNIAYSNGGNQYDIIRFVPGDVNGAGVVIGGGGTAIFGSGESAYNFQGSSGADIAGSTESTYITSDSSIGFYTNCQTIDDRVGVILNASRHFYPDAAGTGSLGTSSRGWNYTYTNNLYIRDATNSYTGGRFYTADSTATSAQSTILTIGNSTASGTAGNRYGILRVYSTSTGYGELQYNDIGSFGTFRVTNTKGDYYGILLGAENSGMAVISMDASHQGLYQQSNSKWIIHHNGAGSICIGGTTVAADYPIVLNGYTKQIGSFWSTNNIYGNNIYPNATNTYNLGSTSYVWATGYMKRLHLYGAADDAMTADSTNPGITFSEYGVQPVHLIYSDYDSYRSPAGLKVVGGASATPAWFEVEGALYAGNIWGNNMYPNDTSTYNLGSTNYKWNNIYTDTLTASYLAASTIQRMSIYWRHTQSRYGEIIVQNSAGTIVGGIISDVGNVTNIEQHGWRFRSYCANSTSNTATTGAYEDYLLPISTSGRTAAVSYDILTTKPSSNTYTVGRLIATATTDAAYDAANNVALITGSATGTHLEFDGNEIFAKADGTTAGILYLQSGGGDVSIASAGTTTIGSKATFTNSTDGGFTFAGRIDVGCLLLTNTSWAGYGTVDPSGLAAVKGRVYFKLI